MINKRLFLAGLTTGLLSLSAAFPAMAGSWKNGAGDNAARWWYDNGDNTWAANGWRWIDGNQDGVSECYYFDAEGWLLTSTTTPDGYNVNADGAWTVNGIVQSRQTAASDEFDNESWDDFQNAAPVEVQRPFFEFWKSRTFCGRGGLFCENKVPGRPPRGQHKKGAGLPGEVCKIP